MPRSTPKRTPNSPRNRNTKAASGDTRTAGNGESNQSASRPSRSIPAERNALLTTPRHWLLAAGAVLAVAFAWSYWPTLTYILHAWDTQPDYSHGYFVVPLALYFLWARKDRFPGVSQSHHLWPALALFGVGLLLRYAAAIYYLQPVDGWSILFWVAGVVWLLGGWKWLRWTLPSIAFLVFMIPLPWRVERWLSLPLQRVATVISGWTLQCFGLPAITEGNIITLGEQQLEVAQACSGLRIFVGIAALAFAYLVLVKRSWWEKALLVVAILPISLIANSARIVLTGVLYSFVSKSAGDKFSHDLAGYLMIPFAALLFALTLWYLSWLFPVRQQMDVRAMIRSRTTGPEPQAT